ncbi:hypothetical protein KY339_04895 [Candidatus Woesearchaeota archaeon]|nr:hypothetical protein [Candidatus Woesearchaeota archaeon]
MNKRAQISMEYVTIVGFVAAILIPMMIIFYTYSDQTEDQIISSQVDKISKKVADAAESVYYMGEPSKTTIKAYFPKNIENITVGNQEIVFFVHTKNGIDEVVTVTSIDINGSLTSTSGIHHIDVQSKGTYVEISD